MKRSVILDCETGRRLGCESFCCRLIVRLEPGEADRIPPYDASKRCVDKDPQDGLCVHFDRSLGQCTIWALRPLICRSYDCNQDPLLQIVLRDGFVSLTRLVRSLPSATGPQHRVPRVDAHVEPSRGSSGEIDEFAGSSSPAENGRDSE